MADATDLSVVLADYSPLLGAIACALPASVLLVQLFDLASAERGALALRYRRENGAEAGRLTLRAVLAPIGLTRAAQ